MQVVTSQFSTQVYGGMGLEATIVVTVPSAGDTIREARLRVDITKSIGNMPTKVFLAENQPARRMVSVCGVSDINSFPADASVHVNGVPDFYRVAYFDKVVPSPNAADEAIDRIKARLNMLVRDWEGLGMASAEII